MGQFDFHRRKVPRSYSQAEENACSFTELGMTKL